jgi:hypothetical protein
MSDEKKDIGAMWIRQSSKGLEYMTGSVTIEGKLHEVVAFRNDKGGNEKRPDWKIYPATPRDASAGIRKATNGETDVPF